MNTNLNIQIETALKAYLASEVEDQVDYQKIYLYSIVTNSTAIEDSDKKRQVDNSKIASVLNSIK